MALNDKDKLRLIKIEKEKRMRSDAQKNVNKTTEEREQYWRELSEDVPIKVAQGITAGSSDEIYGAYKHLTGQGDYTEERNYARGLQSQADERSPKAAFLSEMAGGALTGMGASKLVGTGLAATMAEGAAYGLGDSQAEDAVGMAKDAARGAAYGGVAHGITKIIKGATVSDPSDIRAKYTGAGPEEFRKLDYHGDPVDMSDALDEIDFYTYKNSKYNLNTHKMEKVGNNIDFPTVKDSIKNSSGAMESIQGRKNRIIRGKKGSVSWNDLADTFGMVRNDVVSGSSDGAAANKAFMKAINPVLREMEGGVSYSRLEKLKKIWQEKSASYYDNLGNIAAESTEAQKISAGIAGVLKNKMEDDIPSLFKLNESWRYFKMANDGLRKARAVSRGGKGGQYVSPVAGVPYVIDKTGRFVGAGERGSLARARVGDFMDAPAIDRSNKGKSQLNVDTGNFDPIPEKAGFASKAFEGLNQAGKTMGLEKTLNGASQIGIDTAIPALDFMIPPIKNDYEESVQSRNPGSIPEQLIRWKIPRDTESMIQNTDKILMKVAQMDPMKYDDMKEILEENPEKIKDLAPILAQTMPHLFEDDKYDRIDNIIIDPNKKQMAREDLKLNESLSNSQRIMKLNELNKTGEYDL